MSARRRPDWRSSARPPRPRSHRRRPPPPARWPRPGSYASWGSERLATSWSVRRCSTWRSSPNLPGNTCFAAPVGIESGRTVAEALPSVAGVLGHLLDDGALERGDLVGVGQLPAVGAPHVEGVDDGGPEGRDLGRDHVEPALDEGPRDAV